jgi:ribulose-5-phosphate 4-epimerase/fuculose-1-phosphate aldolase
MSASQNSDADALIKSQDPKHPANLICSLCRQFYTFGWVTGTGGGVSIRHEDHIFLAPSGVEKELMQPDNIFVMDWASKEYIRRPLVGLVDSEKKKPFSLFFFPQRSKSGIIIEHPSADGQIKR